MQAAHAGITRGDLAVGAATAAVVHAFLGLAIWFAPATETGADKEEVERASSCAAVVSTACVTPMVKRSRIFDAPERKPPPLEDRRCPEPVRRILRRDLESPPAVEVDLLQAELVAAKGIETGTVIAQPAQATVKPAEAKPKLAEALGQDTKLKDMLAEPKADDKKVKKLGDILGRADGSEHGEGKVNRTGSAYVTEVQRAILKSFQIPAGIPPWELADLAALVRVTRMTASGAVLEWKFDKHSENDAFDGAISGLMNGYKSGLRSLPEPPGHILDQINSRGFVIRFSPKH